MKKVVNKIVLMATVAIMLIATGCNSDSTSSYIVMGMEYVLQEYDAEGDYSTFTPYLLSALMGQQTASAAVYKDGDAIEGKLFDMKSYHMFLSSRDAKYSALSEVEGLYYGVAVGKDGKEYKTQSASYYQLGEELKPYTTTEFSRKGNNFSIVLDEVEEASRVGVYFELTGADIDMDNWVVSTIFYIHDRFAARDGTIEYNMTIPDFDMTLEQVKEITAYPFVANQMVILRGEPTVIVYGEDN